ncbi:MAG: hypothetical protein NZM25_06540 [Leptospiraceae bacterium]|nr:hypothetical protein [Leptospiraceae bacterium]MDW8306567.1 hypothetical protein [Leptospiraceae bacterium]
MSELLFVRRSDGSYGLSEKGVERSYFLTMKRLLSHYLQNGLKRDPTDIQKRLIAFQDFAQKKLSHPDAYLENLENIAQLIGEPNSARFATYIGQYFLSQLEKTQQQMLTQELPRIKAILENPYHTPSMDFLLKYQDLFLSAKPLVWPPPNQQDAEPQLSQIQETQTIYEKPQLPGERLLMLLGQEFSLAKELSLKPQIMEPELSHETAVEEGNLPTSSSSLPGERLLQTLGSEFQKSQALRWQEQMVEVAEEVVEGPRLPVQISLREYIEITQRVKKFTQSQDQAGYQKWFAGLNIKGKLILHINNLVQRQRRGEEIYWPHEYMNLIAKTGLDSQVMAKMKEEISAYVHVSQRLSQILHQALSKGLAPTMAQSLYGQLLAVFENKDNYEIKKTALRMSLLAIHQKELKNFLEQELSKLLDEAADLYPLEKNS